MTGRNDDMTTTKPPPYDEIPHWSGNDSLPQRRRSVWSLLGVALAIALGVLGLLVVASLVTVFIALNNYGSNK
jgi:hypothetical protein